MMEVVEYLPGALAAGWMVVKMVTLFRNGPAPEVKEQAAWD
jgi:hypothetical protein